jgi:hypothetical protein
VCRGFESLLRYQHSNGLGEIVVVAQALPDWTWASMMKPALSVKVLKWPREKQKTSDVFAKWRTRVRIFLAAIVFGLLTNAAYAKDFGPLPETPPQKADEQAYRDAVKRIPEQKSSSDPWGTVRDTGAPNNNQNKKSSGSK